MPLGENVGSFQENQQDVPEEKKSMIFGENIGSFHENAQDTSDAETAEDEEIVKPEEQQKRPPVS